MNSGPLYVAVIVFSPSIKSALEMVMFAVLLVKLTVQVFPLISIVMFPVALGTLMLTVALFPIQTGFATKETFANSFSFTFIIPVALFALCVSSPLQYTVTLFSPMVKLLEVIIISVQPWLLVVLVMFSPFMFMVTGSETSNPDSCVVLICIVAFSPSVTFVGFT